VQAGLCMHGGSGCTYSQGYRVLKTGRVWSFIGQGSSPGTAFKDGVSGFCAEIDSRGPVNST